MPQTKEQKKKVIEDIKEKIGKQKSIVFAAIEGLKAKDLFELRKKLKNSGCLFLVAKKTLLSLAAKGKKLALEEDKLKGQVALIFGFEDEISPAKIIHQFALKNENIKILGGVLENKFIGKENIIALAKLPAKNELLAKLVGTIAAPMLGFANVLQGNIKGLITVLAKIKT